MRRNIISKFKSSFFSKKSPSLSIEPHDWKNAVSEAEKIVGISTSSLSVRNRLVDELNYMAFRTAMLVGKNHPISKMTWKLYNDRKASLKARGLMVGLISKAAGPSKGNSPLEEMINGIYPSQRILAEITDMIYVATMIHKSVINLPHRRDVGTADKSLGNKMVINPPQGGDESTADNMELGNKMAILSGDCLLANASKSLTALYNTEVVEIISTAIRDLMKGEFTRLNETEQRLLKPECFVSNISIESWEKQAFLSSGSLLAHSCRGALVLAQHARDLQDAAFRFGNFMALSRQLKEEFVVLHNPALEPEAFNLASLPIILYLNKQQNPAETFDFLQNSTEKEISTIILGNEFIVKELNDLCKEYGNKAIKSLSVFERSDATRILTNMVKSIMNI